MEVLQNTITNILEFIQTWDENILMWIQENLRFDFLTWIMKKITFLGDSGWFWIVLATVCVCFKKIRKIGWCIGVSLALGALITNIILKNLVHRVRPYNHMESLELLITAPTDWSFPSGHTTASFAAAGIIANMMPARYGKSAYLLAILIAFSRLYLGVHYLSDVLVGMIVGLLSSRIVCDFYKKHHMKNKNK